MMKGPELKHSMAERVAAKVRGGSYVVWSSISVVFVVARLDGGGTDLYWLYAILALLVPFFVHFFSRRSKHPFPITHRELLVAAMLQGVAVALLEFRPLPTLAVAAPVAGFVLGGGLKLLAAGCLAFLAGALLAGLGLGYSIETDVGVATNVVSGVLVLVNQFNMAMVALKSQNALGVVYRDFEDKNFTDSLTGLKNRRFLAHAMDERCENSIRFHEVHGVLGRKDLVMCLLRVDDTESSDRILLETAHRLLDHAAESDLLVRFDETSFLMISSTENRERCAMIAEKVLQLALDPVEIVSGQIVVVTATVGMAVFPFVTSQPRLMSWEDVVFLTESAEAEASRSGLNCWRWVVPGRTRWDNGMVAQMRVDKDFPGLLETGALRLIS
jgi:GGDEF domain-containing protein